MSSIEKTLERQMKHIELLTEMVKVLLDLSMTPEQEEAVDRISQELRDLYVTETRDRVVSENQTVCRE